VSRSGARWSEAQRKQSGLCRINARVSPEAIDALRLLAERRGETQGKTLQNLIRVALQSETEEKSEVR
jgi:hypothetical protein